MFEKAQNREPKPPSELDLAVTDLLAASLAGTEEQREQALEEIRSLHTPRAMKRARLEDQPEMRGLVALCIDLANSTLDDPQEYRKASKKLLRSLTLTTDPALESRLAQRQRRDATR